MGWKWGGSECECERRERRGVGESDERRKNNAERGARKEMREGGGACMLARLVQDESCGVPSTCSHSATVCCDYVCCGCVLWFVCRDCVLWFCVPWWCAVHCAGSQVCRTS